MTDDLNKPLLPSRSIPQDGDEMEDVLLTTEACFSVGDEGLFSVGAFCPLRVRPACADYVRVATSDIAGGPTPFRGT